MEILNACIRAIASLLILHLLTKWTGPKQLSQCSYYDYIVSITIGNVAATFAFDSSIPWTIPVAVMILYSASGVFQSWITTKSITARRLLTGVPTIIMFHGKIIQENLNKVHFDIHDLTSQCRMQGYFNLDEIDTIVLETSGQLSIMLKSQYEPVKIDDTDIKVSDAALYANIIIDGHIMKENLHSLGFDENWLKTKLKENNSSKVENILLAIASQDQDFITFDKHETMNQESYFI